MYAHLYISSCFKEGREQCPFFANEGLEETEQMFKVIEQHSSEQQYDVSKELADGVSFMQSCWAFGQNPEVQFASFPPVGVSMVKVLAYGNVKWLIFEAEPLKKASKK